MKVTFVIVGEPASKSNSSQIIKIGKGAKARYSIIKSQKAREYVDASRLQIPHSARLMLEGPVRVTMKIHYATERPDLDESLVLDVLQAEFTRSQDGGERNLIRAGVYRNDRQVREKHIFHAIDKHNPRVEIEVEQLAGAMPSLFEPDAMPIPTFTPPPRKRTERPAARARAVSAVPPGEAPF